MKKHSKIIISIIIFLIMLLIYIFLRKSGIAYRFLLKKNIYDEIGINVINCKVVNSYDSHGGMQYDGDLFVQVECKKIKEEALRKIKGWRALPLTNNLAFRIYGDIEQKMTFFNLQQKCIVYL